ncbi:MAG: sporulation protein YqfD, partial [Lachnospira sp.]|nr:sporulation protein YqfD [Lachnospira sp.]
MEASKSPFTYLLIKIEGEEKERFLNLCRHNNIGLWDIVIKDECIFAKIKRNDFLKIKNIRHKAHIKIRVMKKRMLRYTFFKYRKHYAFALGIFIAAVFVKIMSLFIWNISFEGNSKYTDSTLRKYLNELDINTGILINDVDCDYIETSMRNNYFDITWVSSEIRGTRLVIHVKESDSDIIPDDIISDSSIDYDSVTADNLVASEDGNVVSIITRNGTPLVKAGDTVQKGDVL